MQEGKGKVDVIKSFLPSAASIYTNLDERIYLGLPARESQGIHRALLRCRGFLAFPYRERYVLATISLRTTCRLRSR